MAVIKYVMIIHLHSEGLIIYGLVITDITNSIFHSSKANNGILTTIQYQLIQGNKTFWLQLNATNQYVFICMHVLYNALCHHCTCSKPQLCY